MSGTKTLDVLTQLRELEPIIAARYKTRTIGLFGSFVRGEERTDSDIDLLVEFEDEADLFDLVGLTQHLEETLQRKVDIVPRRALREELRATVLGEVIAV